MTVYRGTVVDVVAGRPVVRIPRLVGLAGEAFGPLPALEVQVPAPAAVPGYTVGDQVLVDDELDGRVDHFVVLGRLL